MSELSDAIDIAIRANIALMKFVADAPRRATDEEFEMIREALKDHFNEGDDQLANEAFSCISSATVIPSYNSDCPGYSGKVIYLLFGAGPEVNMTLIQSEERLKIVCDSTSES